VITVKLVDNLVMMFTIVAIVEI